MKNTSCSSRLLLAFSVAITSAVAFAEEPTPTEFTFVLESRSASTNVSKSGAPEFYQACPPIDRRYRKTEWSVRKIGHHEYSDIYGFAYGTDGDYSYKLTDLLSETASRVSETCSLTQWSFTPTDEITDIWDEFTSIVPETNDWHTTHRHIQPPNPDTWTTNQNLPSWAFQYPWMNESFPEGYQKANTTASTDVSEPTSSGTITTASYTEGNSEYAESMTARMEVLNTLDMEFTTEELIASAKPAVENVDWAPSGSESAHALAEITSDELSVSVAVAEARFKVFAPKDQPWEIPYWNWRRWSSNGVTVVTPEYASLKGVGTGGWIYTNVPLKAAFSTTSSGNCTFYAGESTWIELISGCATGGCCDGAPGATKTTVNSVRVEMSLGSGAFGEGSGGLLLLGEAPDPRLTTPAGLETTGNFTGFEVIRSAGVLRQVVTPSILADIAYTSPTSYSVKFYTNWGGKVDGVYDVAGCSHFSETAIAQGSSTNQIIVTCTAQGVPVQHVYDWSDADQGWTLTSAGLRKEAQVWSQDGLAMTRYIKDSGNHVLSEETTYFRALEGWGKVTAARVRGSGPSALTNQWFYYDNAVADGTNYGRLKMTVDPSGFWQRYEYDSDQRITKLVSQVGNSATNAADSLCKVVEHDYTPVTNGCTSECRTTKLLGVPVSREFTVAFGAETLEVRCADPDAKWDSPGNLITTNKYYATGDFAGKIRSSHAPDGTVQAYFYSYASNQKETTVLSGQPDSSGTNVVNGTKSVETVGASGELVSRWVYAISDGSAWLKESEAYQYHDSLKRSRTVTYLDGSTSSFDYNCCGLAAVTNRDFSITTYTSDLLKRQVASTTYGVTTTNVLDAAGNVLAVIRIGTDNTRLTNAMSSYDTAGRAVLQTNALLGVTSWDFAQGGRVVTATYPDGGTRIETLNQDGSLQSLTGTAAHPVRYEYGVEDDGTGVTNAFSKTIKLGTNYADTAEWTKAYTDPIGRTYKTISSGVSGASLESLSLFNLKGQLSLRVERGVTNVYVYNAQGELQDSAIDMNGNGQIDYNGSDRISRSVTDYYTRAEGVCRRTRTYVWPETGLDTPILASTSEVLLDGSKSWAITDVGTRRTEITLNAGTGARTVRTYAPDGSYAQETWEYGKLTSSSRCDNSSAPIGGTSYSYDSYGRQAVAADARNGATMLYYNAADMVEATTTPSPDGVQAGLATTNLYSSALRLYRTVLPDGGIVNYEYYPTGLRKKTWGSREYPVQYEYDSQGRLTKMKTWQGFAASSGEAVTTWNYQPATGLLLNKRYADGNGPSYEYTPEGRLQTRTWARGTTTGYTYGPAGDLLTVDYSDSTPDLVYAYDRRGRQTGATQGGTVTLSRTYNGLGAVSSERFAGGPLNGLTVTNRFDGYLRRTNVALLNSSQAVLASTGIEFDGASRLYRVSQPSILGSQPVSATYSYVANSALVEQIEFARNGAGVMKTTNHWDKLNRLGAVASEVSGAPVAVHAYQYNLAGQRAAVTNVDNAFWVYSYDSLGQVTSGKKYFQDGTPVAGQQFEYGFDDIGNRKTAAAGGDAAGQNLRQQRYTANLLNQYTERRNPQSFGILGSANPDATVTVWGPDGAHARATRQGEHFYGELAVSNYPGPVWLKTTNTAFMSVNDAELWTNTTGKALVPPTPQVYTHDLDGNLTADGLWTRTWNAENRVLTVESVSALPADAKKREVWTYLPDGRWIERIVSTNNGSAYYPALTNRYVWDGQVLLAVLDHANGLVMSFVRGMDLSGSVQGAGGVGGVLAVNHNANSQPSTHFVSYDGNGNVVGLSDAATGASTARYEYGPFGELQRVTGPMAAAMPLRFSTMYSDDVTDDTKYLFRDYRVEEGRWTSRDPIQEQGGLNLYGFVANDSISLFDVLGLGDYVEGSTPPPNSQPLDRSTWNTIKGDFGEIQVLSTRAVSAVLGGYSMGWRDAAAHLKHFLLNSGTTYTIRFKGMNEESAGAKSHYISEINDALAAAERLTQNKGSVDMVTVTETSGNNAEGNWKYAVGLYRTWAKGTAKRDCNDNYELQWSFNFRDNYDWDLNNGLGVEVFGIMIVSDREMGLLHRYGVAREYEMIGEQKVVVKWKKGQRFESGAKVSDGGR